MNAQTKNIVLGCVVVVALGAAGYFAVRGSGTTGEFPDTKVVHGVCLRTGNEFTLTVPVSERAPYENPDTGERTVYSWWYCYDCKHRFVPPPVASRDGGLTAPTMPACPECGSMSTGAYDPEFADELVGTVELPKLDK